MVSVASLCYLTLVMSPDNFWFVSQTQDRIILSQLGVRSGHGTCFGPYIASEAHHF